MKITNAIGVAILGLITVTIISYATDFLLGKLATHSPTPFSRMRREVLLAN